MSEKLSTEDKRGLFWRGGDYARERAKPKFRAEVDSKVTRGQGMGALGGAAGGGAVGALGGAALARGAGAAAGGYAGAIGGAIAGSSHGGKKSFKRLKAEGKIKKNQSISAFGIEH